MTSDPASAESSGRGGSAVPLEQSAAAEPFAMLPELDEAIPAEVSTGALERRASPALILAVLCVAQFFSALDVFIVNVALTPIGRGLHESSLSNLSWILNGYAIVYAALLVPAGRLADRYGRREGFLLGLGLFTAASLGSALSGSLWVLVAS